MAGLEFVRTYIDDLLVITKNTFEDHLKKLEIVFQRIKEAGLKINANKSFFARSALEYLGNWISRKGIQPVPKKVDAIKKIAVPKTIKEVRSFVGMINYYRDMWARRSETEFRNILLGQKIVVHTDHKNLTFKNFNTERVMRWRLILEEYGPELKYIKGENNVVADALSRLSIDDR